MLRAVLFACCAIVALGAESFAQSNEVTFAMGGGAMAAGGRGGGRAINLSYARSIGEHFAAEGSLETFFVEGDDIGGVQGSVLYHFVPSSRTRTVIPYVTAGLGTASTDFTEIRSDLLVKVGAGVKYHVTDHVGVRLELRDEIVNPTHNAGYLPGSGAGPRVRARVGVVFRF
jgi:hypothetical protein